MSDFLDEIIELDSRVQRWTRTSWPESWLQINLPLGSTRALLVIDSGYATTPSSIAEVLNVSRATVSGMLDRLEAEGLISREIDNSDRRSFVLRLTERGRELVRQIDEVRRTQIRQALEKMSPADREALHRGLQALNAALRENNLPLLEFLASKKGLVNSNDN